MMMYTPIGEPPKFAPTITRTRTGYGLALNMKHEPFIEFTSRTEAFDAMCLFEDSYTLGTTTNGTYVATVFAGQHDVVDQKEFPTLSAALTFIEDGFEENYTRPIVRWALTDEALEALADLN